MGRTTQLLKKVSYGKPQDAKLDWNIRQVTKAVFKDPLDVIGQNIENIIDEYLIRKKSPVVCNIYCNSEELIIEDFIGMTSEDIEDNYIVFGVSGKSRVFGRYGHGGKDTALAIAGYFHIVSKVGSSICAYKIWEDKNLKVKYSPAWGLDYGKKENGTLIIIPNSRERFTLKDIREYLKGNFYLGITEEKILIQLGNEYDGRKRILKVTLPPDCEKKPIYLKFKKKDVKQYCKTTLKYLPEVKGFYLLLKEGEPHLSGYNIYSHGKFITAIRGSTKVVGYLGMDFLLETDQITASKELKVGKRSLYQKYLLPRLMEWEKKNLDKLREEETDREFLDEVEALLGPLWGGRKEQTIRKRKPRQLKNPIEFQKRRTPPDPGRTPGHGRLALIDDSGELLVVGIQLPDRIFINKGNPDGKYIWELPRQTRKTLLYSRAAIFLPFIKQSKSGSLTSSELNRVHDEALKSQEFWINAIRRDHGDKKTVIYKGKRRFVVG